MFSGCQNEEHTQRKGVQRDEQPIEEEPTEEPARVTAHDMDQRSHDQEGLPPVDNTLPKGVMT